MPFFIKSVISRLLHPVPALLVILALGSFLRLSRRTRLAGRILLWVDLALFLVMGFGLFNGALEKLERMCPPFPGDDAAFCEDLRGAMVTVLGHGLATVDLPHRFRDNNCLRHRFSEGAYILHRVPESRLAVSMSGRATLADKRAAAYELAVMYGIPTNRLAIYTNARDTIEEARETLRLAGTNRVVLVTSASHMPRAALIFKKAGCDVVPAPCEYLFFGPNSQWRWYDWHFGVRNFDRSERLMHESFGLLFERIRK
jgi:uncharacterized SAM-binding protein YcdF (DUF218 family)